jgi:hypothetical protein
MSILLVTACDGLHTQPNENGEIPPGCLTLAENIVISRDGIAECRRGFETALGGGEAGPVLHLTPYDGALMLQTASVASITDAGVTTETAVQNASNAVVPRRSASIQGKWLNLHDGGLKVYEPGRVDAYAGVLRPTQPLLAPVAGGSMQATGTQLAYRAVFVRKAGTSPKTMMSEPSGRATIANNTGSAQDVAVSVYNDGIDDGYTLQVYRSLASEGATIDPGDELGLIYERSSFPAATYGTTSFARAGTVVTVTTSTAHAYQAGDIIGHAGATDFAAGEFVITGVTGASTFTYTQAGAAVTTASTVGVTTEAVGFVDNVPDSLVGASLYTNASQEGIGQANNLPPMVSGDIAEFRRCAFYGNTKEFQRYKFRVLAVGSPSGVQVGDTITIGSSVITGAATESDSTFQVYTSGTVAENIANTAQSIARTLSRDVMNKPSIYTSGATDVPGAVTIEERSPDAAAFTVTFSRPGAFITFGKTTSEANEFPNRVAYSKVDQPEAVPTLNFIDVGGADAEILRLMPLRDALIVLKEDGVFRITGDGPWNFRVDPFDLTVKCIGAQTAATLENTVVTLTDQGVARISDTGVVVLSRPIEDKILPLIVSTMLSVVNTYAFGVGYDSARKYILWLPSLPESTSANFAYVYDLFTETWTLWAIDANHAVVNPADDKLYVATGNEVWRELKTFTATDLNEPSTFGSIPVFVEWSPKFGDRPDVLHQFREVGIIVGTAEWTTTGQVGFSTDLESSMEFVTLPAGEANQVIRVSVPRKFQRGRRLNVQFRMDEAGKAVQLKGLRVIYETTGERIRR